MQDIQCYSVQQIRFLSLTVCFCYVNVIVGFLKVLQFPPTSNKFLAHRWGLGGRMHRLESEVKPLNRFI